MKIRYKPLFLRQLGKLPPALQEETKEKIALFGKDHRHPSLKTHKLKGGLRGYWRFSVNYRYRIVYEHETKDIAAFIKIGDHDVYK